MPKLLVFAGPNGSGKSTVTSKIGPIGEYVNADLIKQHLGCSDLQAAQIADATRKHFLAKKVDFTFETVLSTTRNIDLIIQAKQSGYHIVCIYVLTSNPDINLARVQDRVTQGGHDVPKDKIYSRYRKALSLIPDLFPICDELYIFDNSLDRKIGSAAMIATCVNGKIEIKPNEVWSKDMIKSLLSGKYLNDYIF